MIKWLLLATMVIPIVSRSQDQRVFHMQVKSWQTRMRYVSGTWGPWNEIWKLENSRINIDINIPDMVIDWTFADSSIQTEKEHYKIASLEIDSSYKFFGLQICHFRCLTDKNKFRLFNLYISSVKKIGCVAYYLAFGDDSMEDKYEMDLISESIKKDE